MKKVLLALFLACAVLASGMPFASAQGAAAPAAAAAAPPAGAAAACPPMADPEYKSYTDAMNQTAPAAKAAAIEAYLAAFPQSCVKAPTLVFLMLSYYQAGNAAKVITSADQVLQLDPNNPQALLLETLFRKQSGDLDGAASFAQKGLVAPKPAAMADADFKTLQGTSFPIFYSAIAAAAQAKKDMPTAIDAFKKELASVPIAQTEDSKQNQLPDTYQLSLAYMHSTPPDYLDCAFYAARFVAYAPEPFKSQIAPTAKYCYKQYHGADDGYDAVVAAATANLNPPADFASTVKPAPTPAEQIHTIIATTPDLGTLAIADKEMVFQYGSPDDTAKVWDTIKGKSVELPGMVIASTPTQLQVAVSDGAIQNKTADFTFNLKAPDDLPATATAAQKAAYKKKQDAIAAATAVGQTVTLDGTYDSFTPSPLMITMSDAEVVLPKAATPKPVVHHAPAKR